MRLVWADELERWLPYLRPGDVKVLRSRADVRGIGETHIVIATYGLLTKAGAPEVVEMHGSIMHLRCEGDESHPHLQVAGAQPKDKRCSVCKRMMRPDVVWFGEVPRELDRVHDALVNCTVFLAVGTSGRVYPAAGFVQLARSAGATCIEVNPKPSDGPFDHVITEPAEETLPELVGRWLNED